METPEEHKEAERKTFNKQENMGELKRRMYSRKHGGYLPWRTRRKPKTHTPLTGDDWKDDAAEEEFDNQPKKRRVFDMYRGAGAFLTLAIVFFVLTGIGVFTYVQSTTKVATEGSVDIAVEGPTSVSAGEIIELQILVTNRNDVPLELADIIVKYPDGTVSPADFSLQLDTERIPLGLIKERSARRGTLRAVMLGSDGDQSTINIELQYRLGGNSGLYSRSTTHGVLMSSDALSITVEADTETTPGQEIPMSVRVKSHSSTLLNNVILDVRYPFGFTLESAAPPPRINTDEGNRWEIGTLRPGEERVIQIAGVLSGQSGDNRTLNFDIGRGDLQEGIDTILAKSTHDFVAQNPFLNVVLEFSPGVSDGDTFGSGITESDSAASAGVESTVRVLWQNNLPTAITDATIAVTLGGVALNKAAVDAGGKGFYRSVDSLLLWNSETTGGELAQIPPGKSGSFEFKLTPVPQNFLAQVRSPNITFAVHAAGKRLSESQVPEIVRESSTYDLKIATNASFSGYGLLNSSPFGATGAIPPKVEYETTYAVVWEVTNTTSDIKEGIVRARLPSYVRWVGLTTPANEQIIYNKVDKTIEWHLGTIKAGAGDLNKEPRRVVFALGLVPSASQIGSAPDLLGAQSFSGIDVYTNREIVLSADKINTEVNQDPSFNREHTIVVE